MKEKYRNKSINKLLDHFDEEHVKDIELGIYDYANQYCSCNVIYQEMYNGVYSHVLENLLFNLNNNKKSIRNIKKSIKKDKMLAYNLAFLSPEELDEESWASILIKREKNESVIKNLPSVEWRPCRDCKGTKYQYYQLQTRSADEPMTTFYICQSCGWTDRVNR